ncbi:MAG: DUF1294 domain-containing protein [Planctomycetota bacterium]
MRFIRSYVNSIFGAAAWAALTFLFIAICTGERPEVGETKLARAAIAWVGIAVGLASIVHRIVAWSDRGLPVIAALLVVPTGVVLLTIPDVGWPIRLAISIGFVAEAILAFDAARLRQRLVAAEVPMAFSRMPGWVVIFAASPFVVASIALLTPISPLALGYLLVTTVLGVIGIRLSVIDKLRAAEDQAGTLRVRESTLHLVEFLGGWPGALIGQYGVRHKTVKASYRRARLVAILLHVVVVSAVAYLWVRFL